MPKEEIHMIQDYLLLGAEARINKPSVVGMNWKWRLNPGQLTEKVKNKILYGTELYGRNN